ncbi:MAG: response regulator [Oligoflexales bacterium]
MPNTIKKTSRSILLVDDDVSDKVLIQKILKECDSKITLHHVEDGEKAMRFLRQKDPYQDVERPDLVLLDLNLPRKEGGEVLLEIRSDPDLTALPVVILSTSKAPADIRNCYALHANAFVSKPGDLNQFRSAVEGLHSFWFSVAKLPSD